MGFGTELQGSSSHEALLTLQDNEIRVLENIRKCLSMRIKCDRDYSAQLSQMVATAQRLEVNKDYETPVYKVWNPVFNNSIINMLSYMYIILSLSTSIFSGI